MDAKNQCKLNSGEKEDRKPSKKKAHYLHAGVIILIAILLLVITHSVHLHYQCNISSELKLLLEVLKEIGISLLILGSITIILEVGDFSEYFLTKLTDIIVRDSYINRLEISEKKELIKKVEQSLYFRDKLYDDTSFYHMVKLHLLPMLESYYYKYYEIIVECWVEEGFIRKKIKRRIEISNPLGRTVLADIPISSSMKKIAGKEDEEQYKINAVVVDGKDMKEEVKCDFADCENTEGYDLTVNCDYTIDVSNPQTEILLETETMVTDDDIVFSHTVPTPCKRYKATFLIHTKGYEVLGLGFGFREEISMKKDNLQNGVIVSFDDWILPGDGVHFVIRKT